MKAPDPVIESTRRIQPTCMTLPRHQATTSSPAIRPPGFPHSLDYKQTYGAVSLRFRAG